jgi:hypothetical protein
MIAIDANARFSPGRIALLTRNLAASELPMAVITLGIVVGLNLVTLILGGEAPINNGMSPGGSAPLWGVGITLVGLYYASRAFKGMHGRYGTEWLLLPATSAEKYLAALTWLFVVWPVGSAAAASAASTLLWGIQSLKGDVAGLPWHPFQRGYLEALLSYWSVAPVLIAGSAVFRKNALVKTLGVGAAAAVALVLVSAPFMTRLFRESGLAGDLSFMNGRWLAEGNPRLESAARLTQLLTDIWRYAILPCFALVYAYFRVAEKEAADEVQ